MSFAASVFDITDFQSSFSFLLISKYRTLSAAQSLACLRSLSSELNRDDAELTLFLFCPNGVRYARPSLDPFFAAHRKVDNKTNMLDPLVKGESIYVSSSPKHVGLGTPAGEPLSHVNMICCTDQMQLFSPSGNRGTSLAANFQVNSTPQDLRLGQLQKLIANRLI